MISYCMVERCGFVIIKLNTFTYEHPPNNPTTTIDTHMLQIGMKWNRAWHCQRQKNSHWLTVRIPTHGNRNSDSYDR